MVRAGQLSSAFGSFLLRYDDAVNPLTDMPLSYGYYYKPVTSYGLAGVQADVTRHKLDARVQWVNSSPANRRSLADKDQYANWASGVGLTITQGLRVGASAYRGPCLHRRNRYYFPGEARPRDLPASGVGIDAGWAKGHWNTMGELQWFTREYRAMPRSLSVQGRESSHAWPSLVRGGSHQLHRLECVSPGQTVRGCNRFSSEYEATGQVRIPNTHWFSGERTFRSGSGNPVANLFLASFFSSGRTD